MIPRTLLIILLLSLVGCANQSRYSIKYDKAPLRKPTTIEMQNAKPKYEPIYPWSIKPYKVRGKHYTPLKTAQGYQAQGEASWYGRKFHGHTTANGEIYDMFAMSAAHKTLPIPSYVRVTNLSNHKSIVVRVNDRGPFHDNRVIDLSYSAAYAIDMLGQGTTQVQIEAITIAKGQSYQAKKNRPLTVKSSPTTNMSINPVNIAVEPQPQLFVQVMASRDGKKLLNIAQQLSAQYGQAHDIPVNQGVFKLRLGPLQSKPQAQSLISALKNNGYPGAYMLYTKATLAHN